MIALIEKSTVPQLRLLGMRTLQTAQSPKAAGMLTESLGRLASSDKPADALFAVRQAASLAPAQRNAVLDAAAKNPSAEVQRLVRLSRVK